MSSPPSTRGRVPPRLLLWFAAATLAGCGAHFGAVAYQGPGVSIRVGETVTRVIECQTGSLWSSLTGGYDPMDVTVVVGDPAILVGQGCEGAYDNCVFKITGVSPGTTTADVVATLSDDRREWQQEITVTE